MPHTISDRFFHQAFHYHALRRNVKSGAWFACVSDATRKDLINIFPKAEQRSVTIHNMVSHHYFPEDSSPARIPEILATRPLMQGDAAKCGRNGDATVGTSNLRYLLIVSTIEPRKNHTTLLSAWEQLRIEKYAGLKLVIVGALGWDHKAIVKKFRPWVERGELFMLSDVPAPELRLLYQHARATICPSFGEGFDFSGIEAMRCRGVVAASDIPVHREVFGAAAEYFNPYSAQDMANAIARLIDPEHSARQQELMEEGASVSSRYLPERIVPRWQRFLKTLAPDVAQVTTSESTRELRVPLRDQ
jgi:glycosyltransferase involved in cell wall biosynthesis